MKGAIYTQTDIFIGKVLRPSTVIVWKAADVWGVRIRIVIYISGRGTACAQKPTSLPRVTPISYDQLTVSNCHGTHNTRIILRTPKISTI